MVERLVEAQRVGGSIPLLGTKQIFNTFKMESNHLKVWVSNCQVVVAQNYNGAVYRPFNSRGLGRKAT